jgi:hypothetical protein
MRANRILLPNTQKWTLHFNWDEASAQTINTSANEWSRDYKTFLILTWYQQNKRTANRTPKSPKRSNTISSTSVVFSSTKFCSLIPNWTKRTPIEIKFYTHMSKYVSKISPNFEINWICKSPTDLKIHPEIRVLLGFSRTSSNWVFLKSWSKSAITRCMQWFKSATHHQSIPKPNPLKGIKGISLTTQDQGKGKTKTIKL